MKAFLGLLVLCATAAVAERNDPPAVPLSPGTAPTAPTVDVDAVNCETKYVRVDAPTGALTGFLRLEARQNSSGSASSYLRSSHLPTDSQYETSCATSSDGELCRIDAMCNYGRGKYFVGVKGTSDNETSVYLNATAISRPNTALPISGATVTKTTQDPEDETYSYDFYTAVEPQGIAATLKVEVTNIQNTTLTVYVQSDSQGGPNCRLSEATCNENTEDCSIEITPCQYTQSGAWYITVRRKATGDVLRSEYTIGAKVTHPTVKDISNGYNMHGSVTPGGFNYYRLPVNRTDEQIAVRVDAISRGSVKVTLDFGKPLGSGCVSAQSCTGGSHSNPICYLEIPFCDTSVGDYFVVVEGLDNASESPIGYTLEILAFKAPNATATLGVPVNDRVSTSQYSLYSLEVPQSTIDTARGTAELWVRVFTTSTLDKVTLTVSNEYEGTCESATSAPAASESNLVTKTCSTSGTNNECLLVFRTCTVRSGTWWVKVEGVAPQHSEIPYTVTADVQLPQPIADGQSVQGVASTYASHFVFTVPPHQDALAVEVQLDSVDDGGAQVLFREGALAGCDGCYTNFPEARIPTGSPVVGGGPYATAAETTHIPPYYFPAAGGTYYIAVIGNPTAAKEVVQFTMSLRFVRGTPAPAALDTDISKAITLGDLQSFEVSPAADRDLYAEFVFNPISKKSGTEDAEVTLMVYNAQFTWAEAVMDSALLQDTTARIRTTTCSLMSGTTTTCSIQVKRCDMQRATGWRVAVWPKRHGGENDEFTYTWRVRQSVTAPRPLVVGTPSTLQGLSPIGASDTETYYYEFNVAGPLDPGQYLEVTLFARSDDTAMTLLVNGDKPAGPGSCEEADYSCTPGSVSCTITIEPCKLRTGKWYASVVVQGDAGSKNPFSYTISPQLGSAKALSSGRGETGAVRKGVTAHYMLAYPTLKNAASFIEVTLLSVDNASQISVALNTGGLAGCSDCLTFTQTCLTAPDAASGSHMCRIKIDPCELIAGDTLFLAVSHENGNVGDSKDYTLTATVWESPAADKTFGSDVSGTADVDTYTVYRFAVPQAQVGKASMAVVVQSAEGLSPFDMYVLPEQQANTRRSSIATATTTTATDTATAIEALVTSGRKRNAANQHVVPSSVTRSTASTTSHHHHHAAAVSTRASSGVSMSMALPNPDNSRCAMATCTNTTHTPCPDLLYPINDVAVWLVGIKGVGAPNEYTIRLDLSATRDLTNNAAQPSSLVAGSFETFRFPVTPTPGGWLNILVDDVSDDGGVQVRVNGGTPVRRSFPSGNTVEYETAAAVRKTSGTASNLCSGAPGDTMCTTAVTACSSGAAEWFIDAKAPSLPKNTTSYAITASWMPAATMGAGVARGMPFGDAAYRTYTVAAGAGQYVTAFANTTDAGGIAVRMGEVDSSLAQCSLESVSQFGPCCKTARNVIVEVAGQPRANNTLAHDATFDIEIRVESPTAVPIAPASPLAADVRGGTYKHFTVAAPADAGAGRTLVVTAEGLDGSLFVSSQGPAGEDGCLTNDFANRACTAGGSCKVNIEPCRVQGGTGTYYVSAKGNGGIGQLNAFTIRANFTALNSTNIASGDRQAGSIGPDEYREFVLTVPDNLGPLAFLEFQTQPPPPKIPSAPASINATSNTPAIGIDLVWEAADPNGAPVTRYNVFASTDGGATFGVTPFTTTLTSLSLGVPQISGGTSYTFKVAADNSVGRSPDSPNSNTVTTGAGQAPGIPTAVTTVAPALDLDSKVTVDWTAPSDNGAQITRYEVEFRVNGSAAYTLRAVDGTPAPSDYVVTGLAADTAYFFRVRAINGQGASNFSSESLPYTTGAPTTVADQIATAPVATLVTGFEDSQVQITWDAPASDGGSEITNYHIRRTDVSGGGGTNTIIPSPAVTTARTYVDATVVPSNNYTYAVFAVNTRGNAPASQDSNEVVTFAPIPKVSSAPTSVVASGATATTMTLNWGAPTNMGVPELTRYRIELAVNGGAYSAANPEFVDGAPPARTAAITGLTAASSYTFRVYGVNTQGESVASDASVAVSTSSIRPAAPSSLNAANGAADSDTQVDLTWVAPTTGNLGTPALTGYRIEQQIGAGPFAAANPATVAYPANAVTITGLSPGTQYRYRIFSVSPSTESSTSATSGSVTTTGGAGAQAPQTAPQNPVLALVAGRESTHIKYTWTAVANDGGSPVTSYTLTFGIAGSPQAPVSIPNITTLFWDSPELVPNTEFLMTVAAVNAVGSGPATAPSSSVITEGPPESPTTPSNIEYLGAGANRLQFTSTTGRRNGKDITDFAVYVFDNGTPDPAFEVPKGAVQLGGGATPPYAESTQMLVIIDMAIETRIVVGGTYQFIHSVSNAWGASNSTVSASYTVPNTRRKRTTHFNARHLLSTTDDSAAESSTTAGDASAAAVDALMDSMRERYAAAAAAAATAATTTTSGSSETAVAPFGRRALLGPGDPQFDVTQMWIRFGGATAGRDATCHIQTRISELSTVPSSCDIPGYCTILGLCDTPTALQSGTYKIMLYNALATNADYDFTYRLVDPAVSTLTLNVPATSVLDKFGSAGYVFTPPAAATAGWVNFVLSDTIPGATLALGTKCSTGSATCTVAAGETECLIQHPLCDLTTIAASSTAGQVFLKVTGGEVDGNATVTATAPAPAAIAVNTDVSGTILAGTTVARKVMYTVSAGTLNAGAYLDFKLADVVNGTVTMQVGTSTGMACGSTTKCTAFDGMRVPSCHARVDPCRSSASAATYSVVVTADAGEPFYTLRVSTVDTVPLTYAGSVADGSDDYLFNDQHLRYRFSPNTTGLSPGGAFLVAEVDVHNAAVATCTHGVTLSVTDQVSTPATTSSALATACDVSDSSFTRRVVDTCKFKSGDWYITARGTSAPGIDSPVNFRVSASVHEVKLIELHRWDEGSWKRPTGYDDVVEYYFDVDAVVASGSRVRVAFTFTPAAGETVTLKINRDYRIGYEDDLEKSCLVGDDNRFRRTQTCSASPCVMWVDTCELAAARYFVRVVSSATAIGTGTLVWGQADNNMDALPAQVDVTPGGEYHRAIGHDSLQQYRITFNTTGADAMLQARIRAGSFSAGCSGKLYLMRGKPATASCHLSSCDVSTTNTECIARATVGSGASATSTACVGSASAAAASDLALEGTWFASVASTCGEADGFRYALDLSDHVEVTPLRIDAHTCGAVGEWDITEYSLDTSGVMSGLAVTTLSTGFTALSGTPVARSSDDAASVAGLCTGTSTERCLRENVTYLGVTGESGETYRVKPTLNRHAPLPFDLGSPFTVDVAAGRTVFAIDVPAALGGPDAFLRVSATGKETFTLTVSEGFVGTSAGCGASRTCSAGAPCTAVDTCSAPAGTYYVTIDAATGFSGTFSGTVVSRGPVVDVVADTAVPSTVEVTQKRTFRLPGVSESASASATVSAVTGGSVKVSLFRGHPSAAGCTPLTTCTSASGCMAAIGGLCDGGAGDYYAVVELATADCISASFSLSMSSTEPTVVEISNNKPFNVSLTAGQRLKYRLDVDPKATPGNASTVALSAETYITLRATNPNFDNVDLMLYQSVAGQCVRLLTRPTNALSEAEDNCMSAECGYVVIPCRIDAAGAGDIYIYATNQNADNTPATITATVNVRDFAELPAPPASKIVNDTVLELYAIPASPVVAHLATVEATEGKVRYWVNHNADCPGSEADLHAVAGYIDPSHGPRAVVEFNDRNGRAFGGGRGAVLIVEGPSGRTGTDPKPAGYKLTYAAGSDVCEQYDHNLTPNAFCKVPEDHTGHEVWRTFAKSALRSRAAMHLAEHIKSKFRCPSAAKCGTCQGSISPICAKAIDDFACASEYRRCDDDGFLLAQCRTFTCRAVEIECGATFVEAGLAEYRCQSDRYITDGFDPAFECTKWETLPIVPSPVPSPFPPSPSPSVAPGNGTAPADSKKGGVSTGVIIGAAVGGAAAIAAAGAAVVVMKKKGASGGGGSGNQRLDDAQV